MPPRRTIAGGNSSGPGRPGRRGSRPGSGEGHRKPPTVAQQHAEWVSLLRPDGPFIAIPVLTEAFPQYLDTVPDDTLAKVRQAWTEVQEAPDLLTPAWIELILTDLLGYTPAMIAEGGARPEDIRTGPLPGVRLRPDAIAYGPDGQGGRAERLLIYRLPAGTPLTAASKTEPSPAEQAAGLCRHRGTPLALLTNGAHWALVHAKPGEPATTAVFDADLWLEERDLLRAFASLLAARRVLPPPKTTDGMNSWSLAAQFSRSAEAQSEVTTTLGTQVRQAVELLVGELSRLDRESGGTLLGEVEPRQVYRGALTVMMRLVFLLYAEEQRLLPVNSDLYDSAYSVGGLHSQLDAEQNLYGEEVGDRRAAAWPRLLATFAAVYEGCEYEEMRIPPYGGSLFDPARYPWLDRLAVTDRVVHEMLGALLILKRGRSGAERLSYKGLDVEQIGHVYEGLLEFSCLRVGEPYLGLIGKAEPELPLAEVEEEAERDGTFFDWLAKTCDASPAAIRKAMGSASEDLAALHAACDNDAGLAERIRPLRGLLRRDLRGLPTVFPAGSLVITQVGDRRATGTHYTPRKLAEEIVKYTLEPLCYSPGPADGADPADWQVRPAADLLDLKVLDPAMGSGAFLVSACRFLGERLVEAWERDGYPVEVLAALGPDFNRDDAFLEAKRRVAARCIYGVDRDEAAVELGKLSLWLVTLAKDQPFSFLDHSLRCGDSLVGLTSESQIEAFHLDPETGRRINARLSGAIDEVVGPILTRVRELREEIEAQPVRDPRQAQALAAKLREAERLTDRLRDLADAVTAAALSTAEQPTDALDARLTGLSEQSQRIVQGELESPLEQAFRAQLEAWLRGSRSEAIRPLHWVLEFPEVMRHGGFDAVVSNPPFMGGMTIGSRLGKDFLRYVGRFIARGKSAGGRADLCTFFYLRDLDIASSGRVGVIATNTIAEGDSREVGLDQAVDMGWSVYRAEKSQVWPGTASLEVALLWTGHPSARERLILDGAPVAGLTPSLNAQSRINGNPYRLVQNMEQAFEGSKVTGTGFVLNKEEGEDLLQKSVRNSDVIFPYLNGEDLNSRWNLSARRYVINFFDWPIEHAQQYAEAFRIVETRVKPQRDMLPDYKRRLREMWWQYEHHARSLYSAMGGLSRVIAIAQTSRTQMPAFVSARQVLSHMLVVFPTEDPARFALHSSEFQYSWTARYSAGLKADLRFFPSDCFENFPQPALTMRMAQIGSQLDETRSLIMEQRGIGLTALYNQFHDPAVHDDDVLRLREAHVKVSEAVCEAYALSEEEDPAIRDYEARIAASLLPAWREVDLRHDFYETRQGTRFTINPQARVDTLDKLLAMNHYRYEEEVRRGLHSGRGRGASKRRRVARASASEAPPLDDGGLFAPEGTLF